MLIIAYIINFLGMILLPIIIWFYFSRRLKLSWKLLLAGGLAFIASQIPHIPFVLALTPLFKSWGTLAYAAILGLLAGLFEETARYILFKFILKKSTTWKEGVFVGLGHGGTEAVILGILAGLTFANMLVYRNIDLSTVPSIPAAQLELAKQQVAAYWSTPIYIALLGMVERVFAIFLHVSLSVMVHYSIAGKKPVWYWIAVAWHTIVDGVAVYFGQKIGMLNLEVLVGVMAIISLGIVFLLRKNFPQEESTSSESQAITI